ncbi:hypothetical protein [Curtobacterium sp. MCBD17_040]|uniref:hypothetical protein n=1 Tax=Curtobacterium sp. MCBD17_040 TaxID=2175674 RepID=UPI0024E01225|nr:hypothetical protein [Curtobacterium sp. MCBD17_040]WIB65905.1 hypothetical protein DEI94_17470 [Curtobacterium sp. MCBD17_040]
MRRLFHMDRAATDPILVIAAIAVSLVLLVGGSFAVAGLISNGKNLNAKKDLAAVVSAEEAWQADDGGYTSSIGDLTGNGSSLSTQFTAGRTPGLRASGSAFAAFTTSASGQEFYVSSTNHNPTVVGAPWPSSAPAGWPASLTWPSSATDAATSTVTNRLAISVPTSTHPFETEWAGGAGTSTYVTDSSIDQPYQRNTFTTASPNTGTAFVSSPRGATGMTWKPNTKYTWSEWVRPSVDIPGFTPTMYQYDSAGNTSVSQGAFTATPSRPECGHN